MVKVIVFSLTAFVSYISSYLNNRELELNSKSNTTTGILWISTIVVLGLIIYAIIEWGIVYEGLLAFGLYFLSIGLGKLHASKK